MKRTLFDESEPWVLFWPRRDIGEATIGVFNREGLCGGIRLVESAWICGGWEVSRVYALQGWGPLLYEGGMSLCGVIHSDRHVVSSAARRVWLRMSGRSDVERVRFDSSGADLSWMGVGAISEVRGPGLECGWRWRASFSGEARCLWRARIKRLERIRPFLEEVEGLLAKSVECV